LYFKKLEKHLLQRRIIIHNPLLKIADFMMDTYDNNDLFDGEYGDSDSCLVIKQKLTLVLQFMASIPRPREKNH